ncbi:MAG TPA: hypothetical protein VGN83_28175 [Falsiroseomonas sp.]|jgi:hypothetical protein|nr:hypothetical protein [Falsiroseomonas sp.]
MGQVLLRRVRRAGTEGFSPARPGRPVADPLRPARGIVIAALLATVFWSGVALLVGVAF